jgi:hypothetical protein
LTDIVYPQQMLRKESRQPQENASSPERF